MLRGIVATAFAIATTFAIARADTLYPIIGAPILRPDSQFEPFADSTGSGYRLKGLTVPDRPGGGAWPTVFTMEGYDGASRPSPNVYLKMDDGELMAVRLTFGAGPRADYAFAQASIRGTECSGGHFDLYDRRHAKDGNNIVEWLAAQPWSNGRVGMFGSSYPGQTAYLVATTKPPHLTAISANLLHSDIYRDIFMPGGVQNILFPSLWTYGLGVVAGPHRIPITSAQNGTIPNDEICTQAQATRYGVGDLPQPWNEAATAATRSTDDEWYQIRAAITYADLIKIPYYQQADWQDEQVGPRAVVLFHHIHPDPRTIVDKDGRTVTVVPKKFVTSNGDHGFGNFAGRDRWSWFDIWLLDMPDSAGLLDHAIVNHFEVHDDGTGAVATKSGPAWPFPDTTWTRMYLHEGKALDFSAPTGAEASDDYLSGVARQGWFQYTDAAQKNFASDVTTARNLPDEVWYETAPLADNLVIAGPIIADIQAAIVGTDVDFFVSISDVWPDGSVSYLQRGFLKASHRAIDPARSYCVGADGLRAPCDGSNLMVQPYRPHTNPQPVTPGEIVDYTIEVFPLGHVFRAGHRILVQIHTPPIVDDIWGYTPTQHQPALVTVYHDAAHPSWVQLPVVVPDGAPASYPTPADCRVPGGFPCTPPSAIDSVLGG